MKLLVTDQDGGQHVLEGDDGQSVMEIIHGADLEIAAQCGGCCACATCHVYVDPSWAERIPAPDEEEQAMLELAMEVGPLSRLSCKIIANADSDGLSLKLAPGTRI